MRSWVITAALFLLPISAFAQNTGFAGRRVVLKLDAYNSVINKFPNFGAEFIATRGLTLSAELNMGTQSVKQIYYLRYHPGYNNEGSDDKYKAVIMPENAGVSHTTMVFSLRKYLGNKKLIPATHGAFFSIGYRKGIIKEMTGQVYEPIYVYSPSKGLNNMEYTAKNISYYGIQAGFGSQKLITSRLSIDFLAGINYNRFDLNFGSEGNLLASSVVNRFGPNVWRMFSNKENKKGKIENFGLFLNFGVGIMLF